MNAMVRMFILSLVILSMSCQPECAVSADCTEQQQCVDGVCAPLALPVIDPIVGEGEGEGITPNEGEGEGTSSEGEGEAPIAEGEGEAPIAEGEGEVISGEGEGEVPVGEGEGEPQPCGGSCARDEVCVNERCLYDGSVCDAAFLPTTIGVSDAVTAIMTVGDALVSFGVANIPAEPRRVQRFDIDTSNVSTRFGTSLLVDVLAAETNFDTLAGGYTNDTCTELASSDDSNGVNPRFTIDDVVRGDLINVIVGGYDDTDVGNYTLTVKPTLCGAVIQDEATYDQCARGFDSSANFVCGANNPCARRPDNSLTGSACCTRTNCGATANNPVVLVAVEANCGP